MTEIFTVNNILREYYIRNIPIYILILHEINLLNSEQSINDITQFGSSSIE